MKKLALIVSLPVVLTAALLILKITLVPGMGILWALSPVWISALAVLLVFYGVWANVAFQKWKMSHWKKRCGTCLHCSLAEIRPGRRYCLWLRKDVSADDAPCDEWEVAIRPPEPKPE